MRKIKLTGDKYIAELNKQLKQHEYFEEGMKFSAHPEGATGKRCGRVFLLVVLQTR